jgi:hypothetical protein
LVSQDIDNLRGPRRVARCILEKFDTVGRVVIHILVQAQAGPITY